MKEQILGDEFAPIESGQGVRSYEFGDILKPKQKMHEIPPPFLPLPLSPCYEILMICIGAQMVL